VKTPPGPSRRSVVPNGHQELSDDDRPRSLLGAIESKPVVLDAGMGTRLLAMGLDPRSDDPALWNLSRSDEVLAIHQRDVAAGAGAVLTNTFGANRFWLERLGQGGVVESVNRCGVALARSATWPGAFVIGDIGPTAACAEGAAAEQAAILVDAGADALILETFRFPEVESVLHDVRRAVPAQVPVIVSLWQWPDDPVPVARRMRDSGANVLGLNCQPGIEAAVAFAKRLGSHAGCPLLVKPSTDGTKCPDQEPHAFAAAVPRLLAHNVRMLGGCCGTSDAHVAALAAACIQAGPPMFRSTGGGTI
jgi:methionine synthase I (cobalamin-dependent)